MKQRYGYFKLFLTFSVSIFLLWVLFSKTDKGDFINALRQCDMRLLLAAVSISLGMNVFLGAYKWKRILSAMGYSVSFKEALAVRSGSNSFKVMFPLKSYELLKAFYLRQEKNIPFGSTLSSLVLDRGFNLLITVTLLLVGLKVVGADVKFIGALFIVLAVLIAVLCGWFNALLIRFAQRFSLRVHTFVRQLVDPLQEIGLREKTVLLFLSFLFQFSEFANTYILCRAVGVSVEFGTILVWVPLIMVINNLPLTVLGIGAREASMLFLFASYGSKAQLFSAGVLVSLVEHILPVLCGLCFSGIFIELLFRKKVTLDEEGAS